mgnify:CR=1 FL=1
MTKDPKYFRQLIIRQSLIILTFMGSVLTFIFLFSLFRLISNIGVLFSIPFICELCSLLICFGWGAIIGGKLGDRKKDSLTLLYSLIIISGFYGAIFVLSLPILPRLFEVIVFKPGLPSYIKEGFAFSLILLMTLIPAIITGVCFAISCRFFSQQPTQYVRSLTLIIAVFLTGAIVGIMASNFSLFNVLGVKQTLILAVALLFIFAFILKLINSNLDFKLPADNGFSQTQQLSLFNASSQKMQRFFRKTTFLAFAFQCVLFGSLMTLLLKICLYLMGNDIYVISFSVLMILAGLLFGVIGSRKLLSRSLNLFPVFGLLPIFAGVYLAILLLLIPLIKRFNDAVLSAAAISDSFWTCKVVIYFINTLILYAIPAALLGLALVLIIQITTDSYQKRGSRFGSTLMILSFFSTLGIYLTRVVLSPRLNIYHSFILITALSLGVGLILLFLYSLQFGKTRRISYIFITVIILFCVSLFLSAGNFQKIFLDTNSPSELLFEQSDNNTTLTLRRELQSNQLLLESNARLVGESPLQSRQVETLAGLIPMLLHNKQPESALLFGLGSGEIAWILLNFNINKIDCIIESPLIPELAPYLHPQNQRLQKDERVNFLCGFDKGAVQLSSAQYDVIISACFHPKPVDDRKYFSLEFFESCHRLLRPSGIFAAPAPIYALSLENFKVILKTFHSAFPTSAIFYDKNPSNNFALLVGVKQSGLKFDFDKISHQINNLNINIRANFESPILTDVYEALDCFLFGPEVFMQLMAGVSVNSLNQPILEFSAPKVSKNPNNLVQLLHLFNSSRESVHRYVTNIKPETAPRQLVKFKIESYYKSSDYIFNALIAQQLKREKKVVYFYQQAYRINRSNYSARKFLDDYYNPLLIAEPKTAFELTENAKIYFQKTEYEEAILLLVQAIEQDKNYAPAYFALGLNYEALGDLSAAAEMYRKTLELQPSLKIVQERLDSITDILATDHKGFDDQLPEIE